MLGQSVHVIVARIPVHSVCTALLSTYEVFIYNCYADHDVMRSTLHGSFSAPISLAVCVLACKDGSPLNVPARRTPTLTAQSSLSLSHAYCITINTLSSLRSFIWISRPSSIRQRPLRRQMNWKLASTCCIVNDGETRRWREQRRYFQRSAGPLCGTGPIMLCWRVACNGWWTTVRTLKYRYCVRILISWSD